MILLKADKYPKTDRWITGLIDIGDGAGNEGRQREAEKMRVTRGWWKEGNKKKKSGVTVGESRGGSLQTNG